MNHAGIGKLLMSWARMAVTYCSEIRRRQLHNEAMSELSRRQLEDIGQEHYHERNKRRERGFSNMIDFR
jgi:hypothetical protein